MAENEETIAALVRELASAREAMEGATSKRQKKIRKQVALAAYDRLSVRVQQAAAWLEEVMLVDRGPDFDDTWERVLERYQVGHAALEEAQPWLSMP